MPNQLEKITAQAQKFARSYRPQLADIQALLDLLTPSNPEAETLIVQELVKGKILPNSLWEYNANDIMNIIFGAPFSPSSLLILLKSINLLAVEKHVMTKVLMTKVLNEIVPRLNEEDFRKLLSMPYFLDTLVKQFPLESIAFLDTMFERGAKDFFTKNDYRHRINSFKSDEYGIYIKSFTEFQLFGIDVLFTSPAAVRHVLEKLDQHDIQKIIQTPVTVKHFTRNLLTEKINSKPTETTSMSLFKRLKTSVDVGDSRENYYEWLNIPTETLQMLAVLFGEFHFYAQYLLKSQATENALQELGNAYKQYFDHYFLPANSPALISDLVQLAQLDNGKFVIGFVDQIGARNSTYSDHPILQGVTSLLCNSLKRQPQLIKDVGIRKILEGVLRAQSEPNDQAFLGAVTKIVWEYNDSKQGQSQHLQKVKTQVTRLFSKEAVALNSQLNKFYELMSNAIEQYRASVVQDARSETTRGMQVSSC